MNRPLHVLRGLFTRNKRHAAATAWVSNHWQYVTDSTAIAGMVGMPCSI